MRPVPIPDQMIWAGAERRVFAAPDGDLTNEEIAPVEALVDTGANPDIPVISVMCQLEEGDLAHLTAGGMVWVSFWGHLVPFAVTVAPPLLVPNITGPATVSAFVDEMRDALATVALAGWKAKAMNVTEDRMLELLAPQAEQMVQSIARTAATS